MESRAAGWHHGIRSFFSATISRSSTVRFRFAAGASTAAGGAAVIVTDALTSQLPRIEQMRATTVCAPAPNAAASSGGAMAPQTMSRVA